MGDKEVIGNVIKSLTPAGRAGLKADGDARAFYAQGISEGKAQRPDAVRQATEENGRLAGCQARR